MEICNDERHRKLLQKGMKKRYENGEVNNSDYRMLKFTAVSRRNCFMFKIRKFEIK
jgi:hypothetical protein